MSVQTIYFLSPPPPKKSTHQHFLSVKNPCENNKNKSKKLKVMEKIFIFTDPPPLPKVDGLYTCENVDIYGQPLTYLLTINENERTNGL